VRRESDTNDSLGGEERKATIAGKTRQAKKSAQTLGRVEEEDYIVDFLSETGTSRAAYTG